MPYITEQTIEALADLGIRDQTLTQILAEIGISHTKSRHYSCRDLYVAGTDQLIGSYDCRQGLALAHRAHAAA